jgi:hypothetical protein
MKNFFTGLILFAALCVPALSAPTPLVFVTISNATVTVPSMPAFPSNPTLQNGSITHGALTSTNELSIPIYLVYQGATTNGRVLIGTWYPSNTNAATEIINGAQFGFTNFLSFDITTTNAVSLSGSYGQ